MFLSFSRRPSMAVTNRAIVVIFRTGFFRNRYNKPFPYIWNSVWINGPMKNVNSCRDYFPCKGKGRNKIRLICIFWSEEQRWPVLFVAKVINYYSVQCISADMKLTYTKNHCAHLLCPLIHCMHGYPSGWSNSCTLYFRPELFYIIIDTVNC